MYPLIVRDIAVVVNYVEHPEKAIEVWERVGLDWKLDLTLDNGIVACGGTFPLHSSDHSVMVFHNDPTFLGVKGEQNCYNIWSHLDECSKLPKEWTFGEHVVHPIFNYYKMTSALGDIILVRLDEIFCQNKQLNGTCHNGRT